MTPLAKKVFELFGKSTGETPRGEQPLTEKEVAPGWPCFKCGNPAVIESVEPSLDGQRMLTFWHCEPCQSYAVTPNTVKEPPKGWATKTRQ